MRSVLFLQNPLEWSNVRDQVALVLLAGGKGTRVGSTTPKQFLPLNGRPIALHSLEVFSASSLFEEICVVCEPAFIPLFSDFQTKFASPGERRQDSALAGFQALTKKSEWVVFHDAARPYISAELVSKLLDAGKEIGAAALGVPVKSTLKQKNHHEYVTKTPDRSAFWEIQTPQILHRDLLDQGFSHAKKQKLTVTDDVSLAELVDHPVKLVRGDYRNIKITTPEDLLIAQALFSQGE